MDIKNLSQGLYMTTALSTSAGPKLLLFWLQSINKILIHIDSDKELSHVQLV